MTLIAGYIINSCPVLLGDVLVSNPKGKGNSISTPTWHEAEEAHQGPLQIVKMVQKVNIVHDQACFAWAGSYYQARAFATALRAHLETNDLDHVRMIEFFQSFDKSDYDDLVCIIYTIDKDILKRYHLNAGEYELDGVMVQTGGNGQGQFIEAVEHFFQVPEKGDKRAETIISPALGFIAYTFVHQIFTGGGLDEGWGGAFEIAYYADEKFQKLDDVLYLLWTAIESEDGTITLTQFPYLVKTNYFRNTFVVKVIDNSIKESQTRIYNISPLGMQDSEKHNPPMSFTYLINYIHIEKKNGQTQGFVNQMTKNSAKGISVKHEGGANHIELSDDFLKGLCQKAFGSGLILERF